MLKKIKEQLRHSLLRRWNLQNKIQFGRTSYSQEGEDILLWRLMDRDHSEATFVDVGSNHPFKMSNTAFFYERGWRGIAIDPNPLFLEAFAELRPQDTFINCGVGLVSGQLTYHEFEQPLFNTFCEEKAAVVHRNSSRKTADRKVSVQPLSTILERIWPAGHLIRLLSVDCEGMDLEVLQSHDFNKYPVEFACIEVDGIRLDRSQHEPSIRFMEQQGFVAVAKLCKSAILVHSTVANKWGLKL